ncbi:2-C-methyl-D-erythritol 4-phosphate cytidylyltransferase [Clostridioides difficile]
MYSVIIVAAGSGRRMNLDINKQFIKLREKKLLLIQFKFFMKI